MTDTNSTIALTREAAETLLRQFICVAPDAPQPATYEEIRAALKVVVDQSDYQMLGVCADSAEQGLRSLHAYLAALDYEFTGEIPPIEGVVYLKFNGRSGGAYMEPYVGEHRGVLVACQSAYDDGVNETFGHLPIDLFA